LPSFRVPLHVYVPKLNQYKPYDLIDVGEGSQFLLY